MPPLPGCAPHSRRPRPRSRPSHATRPCRSPGWANVACNMGLLWVSRPKKDRNKQTRTLPVAHELRTINTGSPETQKIGLVLNHDPLLVLPKLTADFSPLSGPQLVQGTPAMSMRTSVTPPWPTWGFHFFRCLKFSLKFANAFATKVKPKKCFL